MHRIHDDAVQRAKQISAMTTSTEWYLLILCVNEQGAGLLNAIRLTLLHEPSTGSV